MKRRTPSPERWANIVFADTEIQVSSHGVVRNLHEVPFPTRRLGGQTVVEINGKPAAVMALVDLAFPRQTERKKRGAR
jgi:hypothetical protein